MAIEGIKITLGEVTKTASTIRQLNQNLQNRLGDIQNEVVQLSQTWQSDASNTVITKMKGMSGQFEEYKKVVDNYAQFLDQTVILYDSAETSINSNASAFK